MARRIMEKTAEKVDLDAIPSAYQMDVEELKRLYVIIKNGKVFEAFSMAFDYGFVMGNRATRRGRVKSL